MRRIRGLAAGQDVRESGKKRWKWGWCFSKLAIDGKAVF